ncbi:unnamed protein product [Bursaphelenchus okinawaensis]|uniref:F-box domain-containing protein n=1 Tax=Bursaphelenchus okinawaensis TaxID=465554 RepID=A0A811KJZ3_9BILA|nr:unnamed protein product [Bursaphelenchus okinawaensis]CAG9105280.1 unnamed protein product [Bursaphelenchus okinawaensis]
MFALQKITSFLSFRKRKEHALVAVESKKKRTQQLGESESKKSILHLPRESLWQILEYLDVSDLIRLQQTSKKAKYEVERFLKKQSHISRISRWFSVIRTENENVKMCEFIMKVLFADEFNIFHYQTALNWMVSAFPYRDNIPLPMMLQTFIYGVSPDSRIRLVRGVIEAFFKADVNSYIQIRLKSNTYTPLETELYMRFRETVFNVQMENATKALVFSTFLRYFASLHSTRIEYIIVMLLFGPRKIVNGKIAVNYEEIEEGHLAPAELHGISEFFRLLPSLENNDVPKSIRWSKRLCFALLEDLTTSPMWSMQNFVTLLILQPYLALITITVRVDSGMLAEAASVFFYILRWLFPSNNKVRFSEYILNHISADDAREFFIHFRQQSHDYLREHDRPRHDEQIETIREAVCRAYQTVYGFDPDNEH